MIRREGRVTHTKSSLALKFHKKKRLICTIGLVDIGFRTGGKLAKLGRDIHMIEENLLKISSSYKSRTGIKNNGFRGGLKKNCNRPVHNVLSPPPPV